MKDEELFEKEEQKPCDSQESVGSEQAEDEGESPIVITVGQEYGHAKMTAIMDMASAIKELAIALNQGIEISVTVNSGDNTTIKDSVFYGTGVRFQPKQSPR